MTSNSAPVNSYGTSMCTIHVFNMPKHCQDTASLPIWCLHNRHQNQPLAGDFPGNIRAWSQVHIFLFNRVQWNVKKHFCRSIRKLASTWIPCLKRQSRIFPIAFELLKKISSATKFMILKSFVQHHHHWASDNPFSLF